MQRCVIDRSVLQIVTEEDDVYTAERNLRIDVFGGAENSVKLRQQSQTDHAHLVDNKIFDESPLLVEFRIACLDYAWLSTVTLFA